MDEMKIGLGIVTYNRPDYFKQCLENILKNVTSADYILVYNDGSTEDYTEVNKLMMNTGIVAFDPGKNQGVAHAKNVLLETMLSLGCDYLFIIEDDILMLSDKALTEYIKTGEDMGVEHMMFAHHGSANAKGPEYKDDFLEYYTQCVGAFSYFTRNILLKSKAEDEKNEWPFPGLFDENFQNAWEHVEHSQRLSVTGLTALFGLFVDIVDSKKYLQEIPGSIDTSTIRGDAKWLEKREAGLAYWEKKHGVSPPVQLTAKK